MTDKYEVQLHPYHNPWVDKIASPLTVLGGGVEKDFARFNCKYISLENTLATLISDKSKELGKQ